MYAAALVESDDEDDDDGASEVAAEPANLVLRTTSSFRASPSITIRHEVSTHMISPFDRCSSANSTICMQSNQVFDTQYHGGAHRVEST